MAAAAASAKDPPKDPKKEAKRLEEEAKREAKEKEKEAKAREEAAKRESKMREKEAKEKEKEQKRLEKEAKDQENREKEQKRKEQKQKEEDAKREAKMKEEEAKRERKLKEKMDKIAKRDAKRDDKAPVRRHSKYKLEGGSLLGSAKLFGNPLALVMCPKSDGTIELPHLIVAGINFLQDHLKTEGLFRISGSMQEINAWRAELDQAKQVSFPSNANPHSVAGIMKLFFREMPEPLLTFPLYEDWCSVAEIPAANKSQRLQRIAEIMPRMPKANNLLLTELIRLLSAVSVFSSVNFMSTANLGIVFGPNVMRSPDEQSMNLMYSCDVVTFLIENADVFIKLAGGGATIVETGVEEVAEAELDDDTDGTNEGNSQIITSSSSREVVPAAYAARPASSRPESNRPPSWDASLPPPFMDAPPPPPPPPTEGEEELY